MDLSSVLDFVPAHYAPYVALLIVACKLVTIFWKAPIAASKFAKLYALINVVALNIGWAKNQLTPREEAVMAPRAKPSDPALAKPPDPTHPA